jgi:hypothetical protein
VVILKASAWTIGALALALGASELSAGVVQEADTLGPKTLVITDSVSCDSCVIERYKIATIHDRDFPQGALVLTGQPHVNSGGTFLVIAGPPLESQLFLANSGGSIVQRIGREGEGPGEYRDVYHIAELPSAYLVFDPRLSRVTRLAKNDFEVLGTTPFLYPGGPVSPLVFMDGSLLLTGRRVILEGVRHHFHVTDSYGSLIRSFGGSANTSGLPAQEYPTVVAVSGEDTFWVGDRNEYRIEKWDLDGNLLSVCRRTPGWYSYQPDPEKLEPGMWQYRINQLFEDEEGLLWVHISGYPLVEDGGRIRSDPDPGTWTSIIEVLDPTAGTLVASSRLGGVKRFAALNGFFQSVTKEDPETLLLNVEVWGARLRGFEGRPP